MSIKHTTRFTMVISLFPARVDIVGVAAHMTHCVQHTAVLWSCTWLAVARHCWQERDQEPVWAEIIPPVQRTLHTFHRVGHNCRTTNSQVFRNQHEKQTWLQQLRLRSEARQASSVLFGRLSVCLTVRSVCLSVDQGCLTALLKGRDGQILYF